MSKEAMKLALEALESGKPMFDAYWDGNQHDKAITALREALANEALDKKAENARALGLDYEPAQQEPVAKVCHDLDGHIGWNPNLRQLPDEGTTLYTSPPPQQQEPFIYYRHYDGGTQDYPDEKTVPLYTSPPPQRTWVGLTDEERIKCRSYDPEEAVAKTEAKLKEKNT